MATTTNTEKESSAATDATKDVDDADATRNNQNAPPHTFLRLCDMRRAVIACNALLMVLLFIVLVDMLDSIRRLNGKASSGKEYGEIYEQAARSTVGAALWQLLALAIHAGAIAGAVLYNKYLVGLQALQGIWGVLSTMPFLGGFALNKAYFWFYLFVALFQCLLSVYPNAILAYQIHKGIMSKETYHRHDYYICQSLTQQPTNKQQLNGQEVV